MNNTNAGPTTCEATLWSRGPLWWTFVARHRIWSLVQCHATGECCVARIDPPTPWQQIMEFIMGPRTVRCSRNWLNNQVLVRFRSHSACSRGTIIYICMIYVVIVEVSLFATTILHDVASRGIMATCDSKHFFFVLSAHELPLILFDQWLMRGLCFFCLFL